MTNSVGHIDEIKDHMAFGSFTSGPKAGETFDLPIKFVLENDEFNMKVGAEVTFVPNSGKEEQGDEFKDSYIVISEEKALVLHVTEDNKIVEGDIIKRLH